MRQFLQAHKEKLGFYAALVAVEVIGLVVYDIAAHHDERKRIKSIKSQIPTMHMCEKHMKTFIETGEMKDQAAYCYPVMRSLHAFGRESFIRYPTNPMFASFAFEPGQNVSTLIDKVGFELRIGDESW